MTEEEKEEKLIEELKLEIEKLKKIATSPTGTYVTFEGLETLLNLIQRQDRQIQKLENKNKDLLRKLRNRVKEVNKLIKYSANNKEMSRLNKMLERKNRQIDIMSKYIDIKEFDINCSSLCVHEDCQEECIKQYFAEQAKEVEK